MGVGGAGEADTDTDISEGLCKFRPSLESSGEMKNKNKMATLHAPLRPLKRRLLKWKCKINQSEEQERIKGSHKKLHSDSSQAGNVA